LRSCSADLAGPCRQLPVERRGFDVTQRTARRPDAASPGESLAARDRPLGIGHAAREGLSVRGTYERILPSTGGNM